MKKRGKSFTLQSFKNEKRASFKSDKSFKKSWDKPIVPLLELINKKEKIFSTSSCSGRICLMGFKKRPLKKDNTNSNIKIHKKYDASFLYNSHYPTTFEEIKKALVVAESNVNVEQIWLQQEPVIIHIRFFQLDEECKEILHIFRSLGFKKSGIFEIKEENGKVMMEILSLEIIKTIIFANGKSIVSDDFLKIIVEEANKRIRIGHCKIENAMKKLNKYFTKQMISFVNRFWFGVCECERIMKKIKKGKMKVIPIFRDKNEMKKMVEFWVKGIDISKYNDENENEKELQRIYEHVKSNKSNIDKTEWFINPFNRLTLMIFLSFTNENELLSKVLKILLEDLDHYKPIHKLMIFSIMKKRGNEKERKLGNVMLKKMIQKDKLIFESDKENIFKKL